MLGGIPLPLPSSDLHILPPPGPGRRVFFVRSRGLSPRRRVEHDEAGHVVPRDDGWAVKSEGAGRSASIHPTQAEAIAAATASAKRKGTEAVIHGRDGRIRDSDSYGNDPNPPKDKKH